MALYTNRNYIIKAYSGDGLNLKVSGQATNNQNVCLGTANPTSNSQQWIIKKISNVYKIITALSDTYALNYYWANGQGNAGNCDIYPEANNDTDSAVSFSAKNEAQGIYTIKLANYNLYLTAASNTNGANVSWEPYIGSSAQKWQFVEVAEEQVTTRTVIDLPSNRTYNWNQFYSDITAIVGTGACSWTCALDVANIYGPSEYDPEDMPASAWVGGICYWTLPSGCSGSINSYSTDVSGTGCLARIRSEIESNRPVIVELRNSAGSQHFVVAYGYTNEGTAKSDILVFDPGVASMSASATQINGIDWTLSEAENLVGKYINRIRTTNGR